MRRDINLDSVAVDKYVWTKRKKYLHTQPRQSKHAAVLIFWKWLEALRIEEKILSSQLPTMSESCGKIFLYTLQRIVDCM